VNATQRQALLQGAFWALAIGLTELATAMERLSADHVFRQRLGKHAREFAVRRLSRDQELGRLEAAILG
jgi:hypothetical protein